VSVEKEKVNAENDKAQKEAKICNAIATEADAKKTFAETELGKAQPLVEKALAALKSLNKKDFQTAKGFGKPNYNVSCVFICTLHIIANMKDP